MIKKWIAVQLTLIALKCLLWSKDAYPEFHLLVREILARTLSGQTHDGVTEFIDELYKAANPVQE